MNWTPASLDQAIAAIARAARPHRNPPAPAALPATTLTNTQWTAVMRARTAIQRYGGALVADPPGSGKSFIGLQIALEAQRDRPPVLITAPASLATTWKRLCRTAGLQARFLSHTRLSLDDQTVADTPRPGFILVDEAHAFRTPRTRRYHTLARLCRHAPALLLTATPINNSLMDLYFQLHLFLADDAFAELGVTDLHTAFLAASADPASSPLPPLLAAALHTVLIRHPRDAGQHPASSGPPGSRDIPTRTRAHGDTAEDTRPAAAPIPGPDTASARRPEVHGPILLHYDLDSAHAGFVRGAMASLAAMSLEAFAPGARARPPAELLRLNLAKRLESGLAAFAASIRAILAFHETFLEGLEEGRLLRPRDLERGSDAAVQLVFTGVAGAPVPRDLDVSSTRRRVRADAAALHDLLRLTRRILRRDPKRAALLRQLDGPLRHRHVLVFTEFRETAADLASALRHHRGVARLDGSGAWIASGRCGRAELIRLFAPTANDAEPPPPHQAIRTLIATDILSEGANLQDADVVVSYDLPWNPVRLIQRIGRIDRMNSPHERVTALIFMPDRWLDEFMTLVDRVDSKLGDIRRGLSLSASSAATAVSTAAADRHAAFVRALANGLAPAAADPLQDIAHRAADSWMQRLLRHPRVVTAPHPPRDAIPVAIISSPDDRPRTRAALLAVRSAAGIRLLHCLGDTAAPADSEAAGLLLQALDAEPPESLRPRTAPGPLGQATRARLDRAAAAAAHAILRPPRASGTDTSTTSRAVRRVLRLAATPLSDPGLATLADRLLDRLSHGLRAGDLLALREWCRLPLLPSDPAAPGRLLHALESILHRPSPYATHHHPSPTPIAAFLITSPPPKTERSAASPRPDATPRSP